MIENQQSRNTFIASETAILDKQIKEIANIEEEITALRARQKAVEDLQADRNLPVHLLNELVLQLPDGVYLTSLAQTGQVITLKGMAQSNERVSEMLRNLSENTPWFSKPQLAEIVTASVALSARDQRRVPSFTLSFQLARSAEAKKAMEAAGATRGSRYGDAKKKSGIDFAQLQTTLQGQFSHLDPRIRRCGPCSPGYCSASR